MLITTHGLHIKNISPTGMSSNRSQLVYVKSVHAPGTYGGSPSYTNDIAIVELEKHLKITDNVKPACLPQANPPAGSTAYLSGWGKIGEGK